MGIGSGPWWDIREVRRTSDLFGHVFLEIALQSSRPYVHRARAWRRLLPKLRRSREDGVIHLIITSLDVPADQVYETIRRHLSDQG